MRGRSARNLLRLLPQVDSQWPFAQLALIGEDRREPRPGHGNVAALTEE